MITQQGFNEKPVVTCVGQPGILKINNEAKKGSKFAKKKYVLSMILAELFLDPIFSKSYHRSPL